MTRHEPGIGDVVSHRRLDAARVGHHSTCRRRVGERETHLIGQVGGRHGNHPERRIGISADGIETAEPERLLGVIVDGVSPSDVPTGLAQRRSDRSADQASADYLGARRLAGAE